METTTFEQLYPPETWQEQTKKVVEMLRAGKSVQVIAPPGVGKSNLLRLLAYNGKVREKHLGKDAGRFHFVYMDFSEVRERSLFEIIKFILISLSYSLGERKFDEEQAVVNENLKEALEFADELIFFQSLKKSVDYLAKVRNLYLVFMFDRFDDYIPNIDSRFFLDLRILNSRVAYNLVSVFGVTRPVEDSLETSIFDEFHELLVGNHVFLPVKDPPGLAFRFSYLEQVTGKNPDERAKKEIEKLTGGHGKLARLSYEAILSEEKIDDIEKLLLSRSQIKAALVELWEFLTAEEQIDLKGGSKNDFLEKTGLQSNGKITIPLLKTFLISLPKEATSAKLVYDPERNEIRKGDEDITDKLTPSEFRLLRYLMQNASRVCEKDEIINQVWRDSKSQEGVTDQALDQIVYRLRKKIENDPDSPHLIQTVKGRGYKFSG